MGIWHWRFGKEAMEMNDAEKIFDLLAEIRQELQDHIVEGQCQFDPVKVRLALELVKHEIEKSIKEESLKAD